MLDVIWLAQEVILTKLVGFKNAGRSRSKDLSKFLGHRVAPGCKLKQALYTTLILHRDRSTATSPGRWAFKIGNFVYLWQEVWVILLVCSVQEIANASWKLKIGLYMSSFLVTFCAILFRSGTEMMVFHKNAVGSSQGEPSWCCVGSELAVTSLAISATGNGFFTPGSRIQWASFALHGFTSDQSSGWCFTSHVHKCRSAKSSGLLLYCVRRSSPKSAKCVFWISSLTSSCIVPDINIHCPVSSSAWCSANLQMCWAMLYKTPHKSR